MKKMIRGQRSWIRIRGTPDDPRSFDKAVWNGLFWEIERINSLGEPIFLQIPRYMVMETLPISAVPEELYKSLSEE